MTKNRTVHVGEPTPATLLCEKQPDWELDAMLSLEEGCKNEHIISCPHCRRIVQIEKANIILDEVKAPQAETLSSRIVKFVMSS